MLTRNLVKIFLILMETRLVASLSKKMFLIVLAAKMRDVWKKEEERPENPVEGSSRSQKVIILITY